MLQAHPSARRLVPSDDLPLYTFYPGAGIPHPVRDTRGHFYGKKKLAPAVLNDQNWTSNRSYLHGLDLFNFGFYWEAHEEWERLLRVCGQETSNGKFLKGLIKLAAAGVKVREGSIHGVRRHAASAGEVFADVAAEIDSNLFCGLELTSLQFAADRAAQLNFKGTLPTGKPIRVFPFVLQPENMPASEG